jgi:hypothetical protein
VTAFAILAAVAYLALLGLFFRAVGRRLPGGRPKRRRTPADVARSVEDFRARRLAERYPDLDHQLDAYADRIRSLYASEGDRP